MCFPRSHPDPAQTALVMSGGEDGTARVMHVQNKRVLGTMTHCDSGEVRVCPLDESEAGEGSKCGYYCMIDFGGRQLQATLSGAMDVFV